MERWNKKLQNILKCQYKELTFLVGGGGGAGGGGVCLDNNIGLVANTACKIQGFV